jgi:hypothetical protein
MTPEQRAEVLARLDALTAEVRELADDVATLSPPPAPTERAA